MRGCASSEEEQHRTSPALSLSQEAGTCRSWGSAALLLVDSLNGAAEVCLISLRLKRADMRSNMVYM